MEIIPLLTMKKRNIQNKNYKEILEKIGDDQLIYIYDLDGIEKDKPNLCTFQKLSKTHLLWIDSGPRDLGDVVDSFMSGVEAVTLRDDLWKNIFLENIREITENKIYSNIKLKQQQTPKEFYKKFDEGSFKDFKSGGIC